MNKNNNQLRGKDNMRQTSSTPTDNEGTAAWANEETKLKNSEVSVPSTDCVDEAKRWVDNGSKL